MISTRQLNNDIADRNDQMYGENWNSAPGIDGIPEQYQEVLNMFYVAVQEEWPGDNLMDLGAVSMANYYGDLSIDSIGFILTDLNGDNCDEFVIGTTSPTAEGGTVIFCIYTDAENPFYAINSVEGQEYYLHHGETDGTYVAEIVGQNSAWVITPAEAENTFDFSYLDEAMDSSTRITLELIPFSEYK